MIYGHFFKVVSDFFLFAPDQLNVASILVPLIIEAKLSCWDCWKCGGDTEDPWESLVPLALSPGHVHSNMVQCTLVHWYIPATPSKPWHYPLESVPLLQPWSLR